MKQRKALLLGLGFWGTNWMKTLTRTEGCEIAGISGCEADMERVTTEYGIPKGRGRR